MGLWVLLLGWGVVLCLRLDGLSVVLCFDFDVVPLFELFVVLVMGSRFRGSALYCCGGFYVKRLVCFRLFMGLHCCVVCEALFAYWRGLFGLDDCVILYVVCG